MKKIKSEDLAKIMPEKASFSKTTKTRGNVHSQNKEIYNEVLTLKTGESLMVEAGEWVGFTTPSTAISGICRIRSRGQTEYSYLFSKLGRSFIGLSYSVMTIQTGWIITRNEDKSYRQEYLSLVKSYDSFIKNATKV